MFSAFSLPWHDIEWLSNGEEFCLYRPRTTEWLPQFRMTCARSSAATGISFVRGQGSWSECLGYGPFSAGPDRDVADVLFE